MDFTIWKVKGYDGVELTKEKLNEKKYSFDEINENNLNIVKQIEETLEKGGVVYCLLKKEKVKAAYLFKLTTKDKEKNLICDKKFVLDEVNKCIETFEKDIDTMLNGKMFERFDIDKAVWRGKEITGQEKFKATMTTLKIFTVFGIAFCCIISLAMIIGCSFNSLTCITAKSIEDIKNSEEVIEFITYVNGYNYFEVKNTLSYYENNRGFAVVEVIIPTVLRFFGYVLLIISLKEILDMVKNVTSNKDLFTKEKNKKINAIFIRTFIALFFIIGNLILWLLVGGILEIILYLFNYSVYLTNKNK